MAEKADRSTRQLVMWANYHTVERADSLARRLITNFVHELVLHAAANVVGGGKLLNWEAAARPDGKCLPAWRVAEIGPARKRDHHTRPTQKGKVSPFALDRGYLADVEKTPSRWALQLKF